MQNVSRNDTWLGHRGLSRNHVQIRGCYSTRVSRNHIIVSNVCGKGPSCTKKLCNSRILLLTVISIYHCQVRKSGDNCCSFPKFQNITAFQDLLNSKVVSCVITNAFIGRIQLYDCFLALIVTPLYSCDRCGLGLPIRRKLVSHLETHGDEEFICEVCDKSFRSKPRLTEHTQKKIMQKRTNAIIVEPNLVTKYIVLI